MKEPNPEQALQFCLVVQNMANPCDERRAPVFERGVDVKYVPPV